MLYALNGGDLLRRATPEEVLNAESLKQAYGIQRSPHTNIITTRMFTDPFMQRALLAALFFWAPLLRVCWGVFVSWPDGMRFSATTVSHLRAGGLWALGFWFGFY